MATSEVAISNRALQKLGASRIESFDQDHPNARSASTAYEPCRDRLLRKYAWNFAVKRASVAADATETTWGGLNRFQKPNDFMRLLRNKEIGSSNQDVRHDWQIEGNYIITADGAPLQFRYVAKIEDTSQFDPLFDELLATVMAYEMCEEVTGSKSQRDDLWDDMKDILLEARQANAYENDADIPPEDDWLLARL